MKFDEVLRDMAEHVIDEANQKFLIQQHGHDFKPFTCERSVISDGGNTFRIKVEFEPDPMSALMLAVERN
jgi:hypothetical protein